MRNTVPDGQPRKNGKSFIKYACCVFLILLAAGCSPSSPKYSIYRFDNGDDYIKDGVRRIVDEQKHVGYADESGEVVIRPRFAFGFPFENGRAKVTNTGTSKEVPGSRGEHHYWDSDDWFYIDKTGNRVEE